MSKHPLIHLFNCWVDRVWNHRQMDCLAHFLAPDFVFETAHYQDAATTGREAMSRFVNALLTAFPDLRLHVQDIEVEGNIITAFVRLRGTHRGELYGIGPTGCVVNMMYLVGYEVVGEQFVRGWTLWDYRVLARQLALTETELLALQDRRRRMFIGDNADTAPRLMERCAA